AVMLRTLSKSWTTIIDLDIMLEKVETNPQFVQIAPPNEMTLLITLAVTVRDVQGFINICFPSSTLEPISDKLSTRIWTQSVKKSEKSAKDLEKLLMMSKMNVAANLGEAELYLRDLIALQIGDVVRLKSFYEEPIDVNIQNFPIFKAEIGNNKGFYAVKIEEENNELKEKIILEKALKEELEEKDKNLSE
ncbi:MAG TPA: FliM/FliN family flagellar motor switch protein, partial [Tepiditoga sp.]|nr:FliM/FliN family flagellar motor switch protein [Tepiditoga sp.]